jgi:hypothetical protein
VNINLNKEKDEIHFRSRTHILPNLSGNEQKSKKPISSSIVPKGCVVEYFDKVVLYQNGKAKLIEETPKNSTHISIEIEELKNTNLEAVTQHSETTAEGKL